MGSATESRAVSTSPASSPSATTPAATPMSQGACAVHGCGCGMSPAARITSWILQIVATVILLQTLFFKFTGAEESVYIFSKLGAEPWGRIGSGVFELIAAVLLLIPRFTVFGAALAMGVMLGAIGSHLGPLGIVVKDDGGLLFGLALVVFFSAAGVLLLRRRRILQLLGKFGIGARTN